MGGGGWTKTASAGVAERKRHTDCRGVCLLVLVSVFVGPGVCLFVCLLVQVSVFVGWAWCQCLLVLVSVFVGPGVKFLLLVLVSVFVCWSWCLCFLLVLVSVFVGPGVSFSWSWCQCLFVGPGVRATLMFTGIWGLTGCRL